MQRAKHEKVKVCDGADSVCEKCFYLKDYKYRYGSNTNEEIRGMDEVVRF